MLRDQNFQSPFYIDIFVLDLQRRDEMAAKHLQRRSSSAERNGESGSSQGLKRPNLHRSSSFTEKRDAQHKVHILGGKFF